MKSLVVPSLSLLGTAVVLLAAPGCASDDVESAPEPAAVTEAVEAPPEEVVEEVVEERAADPETAPPEEVVEEPVVAEPEPEPDPGPSLTEATLGYALSVGDKAQFEVAETSEQSIDMGMQKIDITTKNTTRWGLEVLSVDGEGNAKLKISFGRIHGSMEMPVMGMNAQYDSDAEAEGAGDPRMEAVGKVNTVLANKSFSATVDKHGAVSGYEGLDKIIADFEKEMGGPPPMGQGLNPDQLVKVVAQTFQHLPGTTLAPGATWKADTALPGAMGLQVSLAFEHTLAEITAEALTYTSTAKVTVSVPEVDDELENPQMAMVLQMLQGVEVKSQELKGTTQLDRGTGLVLSSSIEQTMRLEAAASGVSIDQSGTFTVKRIQD